MGPQSQTSCTQSANRPCSAQCTAQTVPTIAAAGIPYCICILPPLCQPTPPCRFGDGFTGDSPNLLVRETRRSLTTSHPPASGPRCAPAGLPLEPAVCFIAADASIEAKVRAGSGGWVREMSGGGGGGCDVFPGAQANCCGSPPPVAAATAAAIDVSAACEALLISAAAATIACVGGNLAVTSPSC